MTQNSESVNTLALLFMSFITPVDSSVAMRNFRLGEWTGCFFLPVSMLKHQNPRDRGLT